MQSARSLLTGLIDYAGLFPPASLGMDRAMVEYAEYRSGNDRSFLGRFIIPAGRLGEMVGPGADIFPRGDQAAPWKLSVTTTADSSVDRDAILHFNCSHHAGSSIGHATCDAIEMPVADQAAVRAALANYAEFFKLFLEVPLGEDPGQLIRAMAGTRAAAKMRTGGVTPQSIPSSEEIIRFMRACKHHGVPFKATAGLHHAVRGEYPLTYNDDSPSARMFGYLNIFLAGAFLDAGLEDVRLIEILEEQDGLAFQFDDFGVSWRNERIGVEMLERSRRQFMLSYGSCSFTEPLTEARELGLV